MWVVFFLTEYSESTWIGRSLNCQKFWRCLRNDANYTNFSQSSQTKKSMVGGTRAPTLRCLTTPPKIMSGWGWTPNLPTMTTPPKNKILVGARGTPHPFFPTTILTKKFCQSEGKPPFCTTNTPIKVLLEGKQAPTPLRKTPYPKAHLIKVYIKIL